MNLISLLIISLLAFIVSAICYLKWTFTYWKRKGVPYIRPKTPFGTIGNPFTRKINVAVTLKKQYQYFKSQGHKHGGMYLLSKPTYMPVDIEYVKNIVSRDFQYFTDNGYYINERDDPLSAHIANLEGYKWKNLRKKLTPAFTPSKIKIIFPVLIDNGKKLVEIVSNEINREHVIDVKDVSNFFTMNVIVSYVFGFNRDNSASSIDLFKKYGKLTFSQMNILNALKFILINIYPNVAKFLRIRSMHLEIERFFISVVSNIVEEGGSCSNNYGVKSFVQILKRVVCDGEESDGFHGKGLSIKEIAAHACFVFMAGHETSATTMSFCLYELASNEDIQDHLRDEVLHMFQNCSGNIVYDELSNMKYMSQVVKETLRKYPPVPAIPRKCVKDYIIPDSEGIKIEKDTGVLISILGMHHDPEYYPDPERFDPERFSAANKKLIPPCAYIPFGEGPRTCMGYQLAQTQINVALAFLLKHFKFTVNAKTRVPLAMNPFTLLLAPVDGIWLNVEKI